MKKKYHLFCGCVLVFVLILLISIACNPSVPGELTGGTSDSKDYVITQNGDINYPKDSTLAVEYYTFLIDNYFNSRVLYFGGLVPSGYNPDELVDDIDCAGLQYSSYNDNYIKTYKLNNKDYYYVPIIVNSNKNPGDYTITARLHKQGFNAMIAKTYTLKVAQYLSQGNWGLNVYQQESYNILDDTKDEIISEFKKMGVEFGSNGVNIKNVTSNLPNQVVNYRKGPVNPQEDPLIKYAFETIYYPGIDITSAMNQYFNEHPYEGLLFFVKNYNIVNPPDPNVLGVTISSIYENGNNGRKWAPISFIFVDRHDDVDPVWRGRHIKTTVLHELGHLWCVGFTDVTHTLWHNSDNKDRCLMKTGLNFINTVPDEAAKKVLNFRGFCTGHLQRGLNISWHLKQYSPYGEGTGGTFSPGNILFVSNTNSAHSLNKDLAIELSCDKTEFIQGESIDVLVRIKNNTTDTINISLKNYLYDFDTDSTFYNQGNGVIIIPPTGMYYFMLDPSDWLLFLGRMDFSTFTLKPGNYEYYVSASLSNKNYRSNKINIKVNSIPDSLQRAFNDLKFDRKNITTVETAKERFEKYRGSFYEKYYYVRVLDFYYKGILNLDDRKDYREKAEKLYKEFILRYSNSSCAYGKFQQIMINYSDNQTLVEEILTSLKNNQPDCKLLEVLRNQPEYNNKIIHLLY